MSLHDLNCWAIKITAIQIRLSLYALSSDSPLPGLVETSDSLDEAIFHLDTARAALQETHL